MSLLYTPPSTIVGISRLAKRICRENPSIRHTEALDIASKKAGHQNYIHAKRALPLPDHHKNLHPLYLTVYWHDKKSEPFSGRCTAEVLLSSDDTSVLQTLRERGYWMLGGFELESPDHLRARLDASSQERARKHIMDAIRELQFCAGTGLKRMRKEVDKRRVEVLQSLPSKDHTSLWIEGTTGSWLALDEPYSSSHTLGESKRKEWALENRLATTEPEWAGLYMPGETIPLFLSDTPELLLRITEVVEQLAPLPAIDWETCSGDYSTHFHSPHRVSSGKRYRARPQPSYIMRAGALPYGGRAGEASQWRPAEPMSIKQHESLGVILRGFVWADLPAPTRNKLTVSISMLDDWSFLEHSDESSISLNDLYYGNERANYCSPEDLLRGVAEARSIILAGYNECRPRRDVLKLLDVVEKNAQTRHKKK